MQLRQRLSEDDAVSPVIGVILMVAITVILAAVIASFVLGMGPNTATTPTASFSSEYDSSSPASLTITMDSGETIDATKVTISTESSANEDSQTWKQISSTGSSDITAGDSIVIDDDGNGLTASYTVKLIYTEGDTSSTMQTFQG